MVYVDRTGWVEDVTGKKRPPGTKYIFEANYSGEGDGKPRYDGACFVPLKTKVCELSMAMLHLNGRHTQVVNYKRGRADVSIRKLGSRISSQPDLLDRIDQAVERLKDTGCV